MNVLVKGTDIIAWGDIAFISGDGYETHEVEDRPDIYKDKCYWSGTEILLKTDTMLLNDFKLYLKELLFKIIGDHWVESTQRPNYIQDQWITFSADASSWTTQAECITQFNNAITWLGLSDGLKL